MKTVSYQKPLAYSLGLHALFVAALTLSSTLPGQETWQPSVSQQAMKEDVDIIQAVTVDQSKIEEEMIAIKSQREAEQKALLAQAESVRQQREAEQKRLADLQTQAKREQEKLKQTQEAEKKRLAELQKQQQAAAEQAKQAEKKRLEKEQALKALQAENAAAEQEKQQRAERQATIEDAILRYKNLIVTAIGQHWIVPDHVDDTLSARFQIRLGRDGTVMSVRLLTSSGDSLLDRSAETAIYKASPLPVPTDSEAFENFRVFNLTVRPEQVT